MLVRRHDHTASDPLERAALPYYERPASGATADTLAGPLVNRA